MSYCHQSIHDQKSYTDWAFKKLLTFFLVKIFFKLPPLFKIPGSAPDSLIAYRIIYSKLTSTNFNVGMAYRNVGMQCRQQHFYSRKPLFLELNEFLPHETYPLYMVLTCTLIVPLLIAPLHSYWDDQPAPSMLVVQSNSLYLLVNHFCQATSIIVIATWILLNLVEKMRYNWVGSMITPYFARNAWHSGTSGLTVTVIKRWLKYMFWGLWAGQPGCKMGDHKTPFECCKLIFFRAWNTPQHGNARYDMHN